MYKLHTRYLASDVQTDVLMQLGCQQRSCSASEFYKVELSSTWLNQISERYTLCVVGIQHASKFQQLLQVHGVLNSWVYTHTSGYVYEGHTMNDKKQIKCHVSYSVGLSLVPCSFGRVACSIGSHVQKHYVACSPVIYTYLS